MPGRAGRDRKTLVRNRGTVASNRKTFVDDRKTVASHRKAVAIERGAVIGDRKTVVLNHGAVIDDRKTVTRNRGAAIGHRKTVTRSRNPVMHDRATVTMRCARVRPGKAFHLGMNALSEVNLIPLVFRSSIGWLVASCLRAREVPWLTSRSITKACAACRTRAIRAALPIAFPK
ncbi:hypothetical protein [Lysobacter sp. Root494]|uniref:hypothetical protein n=1 Tax=Lysobacter sp. Root494 TaxID=1736549 RepID=UPI0012FC6D67|nr:hypothetical protein [Lysobacter sp. Root494]